MEPRRPSAASQCRADSCFGLQVDVETQSLLSPGQTVCDVWGQTGRAPNARVCLRRVAARPLVASEVSPHTKFDTRRMDVTAFWYTMLEAIYRADAHSPLNEPGTGGKGAPSVASIPGANGGSVSYQCNLM